MSRENYFKSLKETSKLVTPIIFQYIDKENFKEPVKSLIEVLPKKRSKNPRLRDLLLRLSYEVSGGKEWKKIIPQYAAAIELFNNSTYIINWFLDGKGELKTEDDKKSAVNAGILLRELAQKVIREQPLSKEKKLEIICELSDIHFSGYKGQNMDLYELIVNRFDEFSDKDKFLSSLYEKGSLVCGYFSRWITNTGAILSGNEEYKDILGNFAIELSSGIQLANDAGDFVPSCKSVKTPDKSYKDQLTDIANGRLTLSTWYCLKYGTEEQKNDLLNLVGKRNTTMKEQEKAVYALRDSGAFNFVIDEATRLMKKCKKILKKLPRSRERDLLSIMASLVRSNKFYATLKHRYGVK